MWKYRPSLIKLDIQYIKYINNNDDNSNNNDDKNDIVYIHTYIINFISHSVCMHHIMYGYSSFHIYICKYSNLT